MIPVMADSDAAFLWETEALRASTPLSPPPSSRSDNGDEPGTDTDWVTLRGANQATGIPVKTLRKWARREHVNSYLAESPGGQLRMVSLREVNERAHYLGRETEATEVSQPAAPMPGPPPDTATAPEDLVESGQPPGTMLVPIDAWDKMLLQLGNLHEAGQQLAEARERAGKAETEAIFLKERLTEMRAQLAESEPRPHDPPADITIETADDEIEVVVTELSSEEDPNEPEQEMTTSAYSLEMMKHIYSTWRGRPRREGARRQLRQ